MKKKNIIICLVIIALLVGIALILDNSTSKYEGYWCKYEETATIVVLLSKNNTEAQRKAVEAKIETFENIRTTAFYSKEDYADKLGGDPNEMDIHDSYVITLDTMDSIGTYIEELEQIKGVASAEQSYAKMNLSLFNIKKWGKYTFADSDEATTDDLETGTYKMKKGIITFTPDDKNAEKRILYTKDGYLCGDAGCNQIYAKSDSTCSSSK